MVLTKDERCTTPLILPLDLDVLKIGLPKNKKEIAKSTKTSTPQSTGNPASDLSLIRRVESLGYLTTR